MLRHIADKCLGLADSCLVGSHPFKSLFEEVLADGGAIDQVLAQAICSTIRLGEMSLRITHTRSRIYGIIDFLVVERLACYIDCLEPFQFLRFLTFTDLNRQLIVEDFLLYISWLIEVNLLTYAEFSCHILA